MLERRLQRLSLCRQDEHDNNEWKMVPVFIITAIIVIDLIKKHRRLASTIVITTLYSFILLPIHSSLVVKIIYEV